MKARSITGTSPEEIRTALQQSLADGFTPTLAVLFISVKQDRKAVTGLFEKNGMTVFGATSCGEFIDGSQGEGGIAALLLDLSRDHFAVVLEEVGENTIAEAGRHLVRSAKNLFPRPTLVLCSTGMNKEGEFFDGETLVETVKKELGPDSFFFGGMAGDDMSFTGSYVFTSDKETDYGLLALVLDADKIESTGMAVTGWKPMGIARTITQSRGSLIYQIDGKPAADMYLQYLGRDGQKDSSSFNLMNDLSMHYPFIMERPSGETVLRTPLRINEEENALLVDIDMPEGTRFWFSVPPDFDIVDKVLEEATRVKGDSEADALLVFSCAGRINVLGPLVHAENEGLHEIWKAPMAGFFTYGEFGRDSKQNQEFHSGACSWVALKEKQKNRQL